MNNWGTTGFNNSMNIGYQQLPVQQKGITTVALIAGDELVDSYPVAAGNTAVLMNFNTMRFWLKTTDIYGRPLPPEGYQFTPLVNTQNQSINLGQPISEQNQNDYVRKEDFNVVAQMVSELYRELKGENNVQS